MCKANVLPPGTFPVLGARGYTFFFSESLQFNRKTFLERSHVFNETDIQELSGNSNPNL